MMGPMIRGRRGAASPIIGRVDIPLALLPHAISPYLYLMLAGFGVGAWGHMMKSQVVVAIGIGMIFLATLLLPLAVIATEDNPGDGGNAIYAPGTRAPAGEGN
jgi:hypothetical protein